MGNNLITKMKKELGNKGMSMVELMIVLAILVIIILIGTVAYAEVQERSKVKTDKASAAQIGKALTVREADIGKEKGIEMYPKLTVYDKLEDVGKYVDEGIIPKSMPDGYFIATAIQTEEGKKILVGIGKEGQEFEDKAYLNKKEAGWAWSEEIEVNDFLKREDVKEVIDTEGSSTVLVGIAGYPEGILYGDANGDGQVASDDAILILLYIADKSKKINLHNADAFRDGVIDNADAGMVLRYETTHGSCAMPHTCGEHGMVYIGYPEKNYHYRTDKCKGCGWEIPQSSGYEHIEDCTYVDGVCKYCGEPQI